MSYQVIARKWRPQTFEEVTGQEAITRTLKNALEHDRLHHAYIFSGARGVGKTTTARLLAKALNCQKTDKPNPNPCRSDDPYACSSCKEVAKSEALFVKEIDAATYTGVDNVRQFIIAEIVEKPPAGVRFRVFIIDEVHMLSTSSFNALLKTLEEPPPWAVFIMATTELHKIPDTILSRCQQFEFRTIALGKIIERLKIIAEGEQLNVSVEALREIARAGQGSMRDAQSAFDQVISFSGKHIETKDVTNALGIVGTDLLNRVVSAIALQKPAEVLKVVDELISRGQDLRNFCRDLLNHTRDLLVAKVVGADAEGLLESALQSPEELKKQAADFSESDLTRFFHSLADTETKLKDAMQPRYVLEIGLVKLVEMRRVAPLEKILERLARLESAIQSGGGFDSGGSAPAAPKSPNAPPNQSASVETAKPIANLNVAPRETAAPQIPQPEIAPPTPPNETIAPQPQSIADGADVRERLRAEFERQNKMWLAISLDKANSARVAGRQLKIEFAANHKQYHSTWDAPENVRILQETGVRLFGRKFEIVTNLSGAAQEIELSPQETEKQKERAEMWAKAEADPLVQMVVKTFRGKILDVYQENK